MALAFVEGRSAQTSATQMLRITINDSETEQKWTLQGSLSGPWVALLQFNWRSKRNSRQGKNCVIDLADLTFVDRCGEKVLRTMKKEGARFIGCRVYTKSVLESSVHRRKEFVS
jgi:anti-anti-sigma regulatory factor